MIQHEAATRATATTTATTTPNVPHFFCTPPTPQDGAGFGVAQQHAVKGERRLSGLSNVVAEGTDYGIGGPYKSTSEHSSPEPEQQSSSAAVEATSDTSSPGPVEQQDQAGQVPPALVPPTKEDFQIIQRVTTSEVNTKPHRTREPGHIKRPPNAWILFRSWYLARYGDNLGNLRMDKKTKIVGALWHHLSDEERQVWQRIAQSKVEEHKKLYPDWTYKPKRRTGNNDVSGNAAGSSVRVPTAEEVQARAKGILHPAEVAGLTAAAKEMNGSDDVGSPESTTSSKARTKVSTKKAKRAPPKKRSRTDSQDTAQYTHEVLKSWGVGGYDPEKAQRARTEPRRLRTARLNGRNSLIALYEAKQRSKNAAQGQLDPTSDPDSSNPDSSSSSSLGPESAPGEARASLYSVLDPSYSTSQPTRPMTQIPFGPLPTFQGSGEVSPTSQGPSSFLGLHQSPLASPGSVSGSSYGGSSPGMPRYAYPSVDDDLAMLFGMMGPATGSACGTSGANQALDDGLGLGLDLPTVLATAQPNQDDSFWAMLHGTTSAPQAIPHPGNAPPAHGAHEGQGAHSMNSFGGGVSPLTTTHSLSPSPHVPTTLYSPSLSSSSVPSVHSSGLSSAHSPWGGEQLSLPALPSQGSQVPHVPHLGQVGHVGHGYEDDLTAATPGSFWPASWDSVKAVFQGGGVPPSLDSMRP